MTNFTKLSLILIVAILMPIGFAASIDKESPSNKEQYQLKELTSNINVTKGLEGFKDGLKIA